MGLMDRIKKVTGTEANDYNYEDDYYNEFDSGEELAEDDTQGASVNMNAGGVSMGGLGMNAGISLSGTALELKVVKPQHFESVPQIADHLLNKRTVVLNLENTNKETARRLIDFLSGVAYSIDGSIKKIASNAYVITPSNVDVGDAQLRDRRTRPEAQRAPEAPAAAMDGIDETDLTTF